MRISGEIIKWHHEKGFGFVRPDNGTKEMFIHINEFNCNPEVGQKISFVAGKDKQGRKCAKNAILYGDFLKSETATSISLTVLSFLVISSLCLLYFAFTGVIQFWVLVVYALLGFLSFSLYWYDKNASLRKAWRIPENTLHLIDLLGGWLGAILAQQLFRHKTKKINFKVMFWLTVVLNVGFTYWISLNPDFW